MRRDNKNLIAYVNQKMIVQTANSLCMEDWRNLDEPFERLQWARKNRGYSHARDAARAMGVKEATYAHHENGTAGFANHAVDYAEFFQVNLVWLLTGRGAPRGAGGEHSVPHPAARIFEELSPQDQARWLDFGRNLRDSKRDRGN